MIKGTGIHKCKQHVAWLLLLTSLGYLIFMCFLGFRASWPVLRTREQQQRFSSNSQTPVTVITSVTQQPISLVEPSLILLEPTHVLNVAPPLVADTQQPAVLHAPTLGDGSLAARLHAYVENHQQQIKTFRVKQTGRFVIIFTYGGSGNRLLTALSGFLLSLLLRNHTLLVNWKPHESSRPLHDLFDTPVEWELNQHPEIAAKYTESYCRQGTDSKILHIEEDPVNFASSRDLFVCSDLAELERHDIISITSCQYFLPLLLANAQLVPTLRRWGLSSNDADTFGRLARFLLRPSPSMITRTLEVQSRLFPITAAHPDPRNSICVHVRSEFISRAEPFLDCVASVLEQMKESSRQTMRIFVASDAYGDFIRASFRTKFGGDRVVVNTEPLNELGKMNNQHNALLDMWLLSQCDELVTTARSTFSYLARGFRGLGSSTHSPLPSKGQANLDWETSKIQEKSSTSETSHLWLVTKDGKCARLPTSQPCLQYADNSPNYRITDASCINSAQIASNLHLQFATNSDTVC